MGFKMLFAGLVVAAGVAVSAPVSAQYYQQGYGYAPPPQVYIDPYRAQRNNAKLQRKQAEFYQKYGYPQRQYAPRPRYVEPRYVEPRYVDPRYAQPRPRYRQQPQYFYD